MVGNLVKRTFGSTGPREEVGTAMDELEDDEGDRSAGPNYRLIRLHGFRPDPSPPELCRQLCIVEADEGEAVRPPPPGE